MLYHCRGSYFVFDNEEMLPREERRIWDNQNFHYDNVATAMLTLFAVQTGEGWPQWVGLLTLVAQIARIYVNFCGCANSEN